MANKGITGTSISILPDAVKARLTGSLDYSPAANEYWYYKAVTISATPAAPILTTDEYFQNERASDSVANADLVKWIAIQHTGTTNGSSSTNDGIMLNIAGHTPYYGGSVTGVLATTADPSVFTKADHGFVDNDVVKCSGFSEMTEVNGLIGTVNQLNTSTFDILGVTADAQETTGGTVEYAGVDNIVIAPKELYVSKLNGVTVGDLVTGTATLTSGSPSSVGTTSAYAYVVAIIKDVA